MSIEELKKLDTEYYVAKYRDKDDKKVSDLKAKILNHCTELDKIATIIVDEELNKALTSTVTGLENSVKTFLCPTLCEFILKNPDVNPQLYRRIVAEVIKSHDLGRLCFRENGENKSFLMLVLENRSLKLTDIEKELIVDEAYQMSGTVPFEEKLDEIVSNNPNIVTTNEEEQSKLEIDSFKRHYIELLKNDINSAEIHGYAIFDLRYLILSNANFTEDEKIFLAKELYKNNQDFIESYNRWLEELKSELLQDKPGLINDFSEVEKLYACEDERANFYIEKYEHFVDIYNMRLGFSRAK